MNDMYKYFNACVLFWRALCSCNLACSRLSLGYQVRFSLHFHLAESSVRSRQVYSFSFTRKLIVAIIVWKVLLKKTVEEVGDWLREKKFEDAIVKKFVGKSLTTW